ncbi:MAG: ribonuclease III [Deltaproteobacteria bacterium]|nr:ribonuclease III [Deltaproteobacteria bacterium]
MVTHEQSSGERKSAGAWTELMSRYPEQFGRLEELQTRIAYHFRKPQFLYEALTHSSAVRAPSGKRRTGHQHRQSPAKQEQAPWNERIEFLGDAILGLVISTKIWPLRNEQGKLFREGELSRLRSALVNETTLAALASHLNLGDCILMSKGEEQQGGRSRPALLADAIEALFGAIYLDGGFSAAQNVINACFKEHLVTPGEAVSGDSKSRLQEWTQKFLKEIPEYELLTETGPPHSREYEVAVKIKGICLAKARGLSKKRASQAAAELAIGMIGPDPSRLQSILPPDADRGSIT